MIKFQRGKKYNKKDLGYKWTIDLPYIVFFTLELRSYDDFGDPKAEIGIAAHLHIMHQIGGPAFSKVTYMDFEKQEFVNLHGHPVHATNSKEVFTMAKAMIKEATNECTRPN